MPGPDAQHHHRVSDIAQLLGLLARVNHPHLLSVVNHLPVIVTQLAFVLFYC
jgi:hypothetical protein